MEDKILPKTFDLNEFRARVQKGNDPHGPLRETLSRLGDRWTPLILLILKNGIMRYTQLLREINTMANVPVSQRILTLKLRALERDGFISRKVIPTVPPQVEYSLTLMGENIVQELERLISWIEDHSHHIQHARESYDLLNSK